MPVADPDCHRRPELAAARERIREAMLDLVTRQGYAETNVKQVLELAGVRRADFKRLFAGKEDCFLWVYEDLIERFNLRVFSAFESEKEWRDGIRAAAYAAARWIRDHPRETRYGVVEMLTAGEFAQAHREATMRKFTEMIDAGRKQLDEPDSVSPMMAEGVIGGIVGVLTKNLRRGTRVRGEDLVPDLMYLAVRPYLGHAAAYEELSIQPPEPIAKPVSERT